MTRQIPLRLLLMGVAVLLLAGAAQAEDLAFLGPRGTYSEQAADAYRNRVAGFEKTAPLATITAVVRAVAEGEVARGMVPAVATTSGFPAETTRVLLASLDPGIRIVGEQTIPIDNELMVRHGTQLADIRTVLSHPNALAEAAAWLHEHLPNAVWQETKSTAAGAEFVAQGDGSTAAVAGPAAARLYGLDILAERIQDNRANATSFWVVSRAGAPVEPMPDRIAVTLQAPAGSSAFSTVVAKLAASGFIVVDVNSVPLAGPLFGYRYMLFLAAAHPIPLARATAALHAPDGRTLLLGAWRSIR